MKKILAATFLTLSVITGSVVLGAETKRSAVPIAAAAAFTGEFSGEWQGENGSGGTLKLPFKPGKDSAWTMEAVFTYEGTNVPTTTKSVQIEGSKLTAVFAWEIQGTAAASKLMGELKADQLEGIYESTTTEGAAKGKWKVARKPAGS